jgi:hypothetical protein
MRNSFAVQLIFALAACCAIAQNTPLAISTGALPEAVLYSNYNVELKATGGIAPYHWVVERGALPEGISLDEGSATLSGVPRSAGTFKFTVAVTDFSAPRQRQEHEFALVVVPGMRVQWKQPPRISGGGIFGSVELDSHLPEDSDLTFIVVAVNAIGKAFVLGYQQLHVQPGADAQDLQFGSTLPAGAYLVHVDAIAQSPSTGAIYRGRVQTSAPLQVVSTP